MIRGRRSNAGPENIWKHQAIHVQKAITEKERPPKKKHVRAIILATFDEYSSQFFYEVALKLPVFSNPVVCWKLLYIIHKLIREGHPECIPDCLRHASKIALVKSAWDSCTNTYGYPLENYFKFITVRLRLHRKYGFIPGNLELQPRDLGAALNAAPDHLFTFSVDLMDMLDEVLAFQDVILASFGGVLSAAFSLVGQCKVAPVLLCIQDAAALYDLTVHVMFKLHDILDNSMLLGHRQRFDSVHQALSKFFELVSRMQYLKSFVEIPTLSQNPPNFLIQSELREHRALRVTVHDTETTSGDEATSFLDEPIIKVQSRSVGLESAPTNERTSTDLVPVHEDLLALTSINQSSVSEPPAKNTLLSIANNNHGNNNGSLQVPLQVSYDTHEFLIEVELLKSEIDRIKRENQNHSNALLERIRTLEDEIKEVVQEKSIQEEQREELESRLRQKMTEAESAEVKFNKLKDIYTKLRDEHVSALRNMTLMQQQCEEAKRENEKLLKEIEAVSTKAAHMEHMLAVLEETQCGTNTSKDEEFNATKARVMDLERINSELQNSVQNLTQEKVHLKNDLSSNEHRVLALEEQKVHANESLRVYEAQLSELTNALEVAKERCSRLEGQMTELPKAVVKTTCKEYLGSACHRASNMLDELLRQFSDAELLLMHRTSSEFLLQSAEKSHSKLGQTELLLIGDSNTDTEMTELPVLISDVSYQLCETLFHTKLFQQFAPDFLEFPDPGEMCREFVGLLQQLEADRTEVLSGNRITSLRQSLERIIRAVEQFQRLRDTSPSDEQQIADQLEQEMRATVEAIRCAEEKFKEMSTRSVGSVTEEQLRVNEQILTYCSALMLAVGRLVEAANIIQKELKVGENVSEFYKQNSRWTQGFLSAAKSVGACANVLVEVADTVANGDNGALGRMMVVAQEVAVSTTHLFVASRVKTDPASTNFISLQMASREVSKATGTLVARVKAAIDTREAEELDFSCLTLTQAKRMEVESQVRVLKLESELTNERQRLAQLRRENYQDAADVELVQKKPT